MSIEFDVHLPPAVAVAGEERPRAVPLEPDLGDAHPGPLARRTSPDRSALVNGDVLASSGDFESDLVLDPRRDAVATEPLDLLDVEVGQDGGHPKRLTTHPGYLPQQS